MTTWRPTKVTVLIAVCSLVFLGLLVFLLGWAALWATPAGKDRAAAVNATRQTFLAAAAGIAAIAGLVTGARTYWLSREGQLTDRYAKAVTLLASEKPTERMGGVFALERLIHQSSRDHESIVEVLTAFVRQCAPVATDAEPPTGDRHAVQAALAVIGRRPERAETNDLNLARTDLRGMILVDANLRDADLRACRMDLANLSLADCRGARLDGTSLCDAELVSTDFGGADLLSVKFANANVEDATFDLADLGGAWLCDDQDQQPVRGLSTAQLKKARTDTGTKLPLSLRPGN